MALSNTIIEQLRRINALLPQSSFGGAIEQLVRDVVFPDVRFKGSMDRMRQCLSESGVCDVAERSEESIGDEMPSIYEFRFLQPDSRGKFWDGWEEDFPSIDPSKFVPFALDDYYFYFLTENPDNESDPLVYSIDHEDTFEEPYDEHGLTLSRLLSIIESTEK